MEVETLDDRLIVVEVELLGETLPEDKSKAFVIH